MARQREFDPDEALRSAVQVFWRRGYGGTSFDDLVKATGVSRYGLYSTLGSKREIYLKSLDYYADCLVAANLARLAEPDATAGDIVGFFEAFLEMDPKQASFGCLLANAATETGPSDKAINRRVERYIENFEVHFERALVNSKQSGQISANVDCAALARSLTVSALGVFVMSRTRRGVAHGADIISAIVSTIPINES